MISTVSIYLEKKRENNRENKRERENTRQRCGLKGKKNALFFLILECMSRFIRQEAVWAGNTAGNFDCASMHVCHLVQRVWVYAAWVCVRNSQRTDLF